MGKTTDELIHLANGQHHPAAPRVRHARQHRRAHLHVAAGHGAGRPRRRGRVLHRQPGRHHHRQRPHPGQDPRGQGRPPARGPRRGQGARSRRLPGGVDRARDHHPRPRRLRRHGRGAGRRPRAPMSARSTPTSRACSPPTPGWCPRPTGINRISFDEMLEMAATGGRVLMLRAVEFARNHNVPLHVRSSFTWEPGTWVVEEDADMEDAVVTAVTHDTSEAKVTVSGVPDRPGIAARLFRALADKSINVDMIVQNTSAHGHDRHLVHRAQGRPGRRRGDLAGPADELGAHRGHGRRRRGPGLAGRCGHEVAPGHRRHHVRDAGRRGDQHRHDLDFDHPDLVHRRRGRRGSGRAQPARGVRPWADGGTDERTTSARRRRGRCGSCVTPRP